jgi:P-type Ca2+ transporter type 2C
MDDTDSSTGLSAHAAAARLAEDGPNALPGAHRRGLARMIWDEAKEPMSLLLLAGGLLYVLLGEPGEGWFLFAMVLLTLGLGLYQESKTERALEALRDLSSPQALVLRDGQTLHIDSRDLVRGDLMIVAEGDRVAADGVLISGHEVRADESLLTGESEPVGKVADNGAPEQPATLGGDALPFLYSGTLLVHGHGVARVTATGARSQIGRIGAALQELRPGPSPLQQQCAKMVTTFAVLGIALSLFLVLFYGLRHGNWLQALLAGIALAMSMLPEEFPIVLTVFPALGAWRLSRAQVLTRRLAAIETLGATSVLCVDKTGTLTENRMSAARLYANGAHLELDYGAPESLPESFHLLVEFAILASASAPFDPMEKAFHRLGQHFLADTEHIHHDWSLAREYALTPELRAMSQAWKAVGRDHYVIAAKGAPEAIIDLCHLAPAEQALISAATEELARQGLRVLAVASGRFSGPQWPSSEHDFDFTFLGLIGLADPLRPGINEAMAQCQRAGIRVIMITGDYPATASSIARQAGLAAGEVLTGDALAAMDEAELSERIGKISVCARVAPEQKLRIVQALKARGAIVAMTGDGVNDAPALRAAHVGIAMGQRGTDVAREAAALVLLDDRFTSIVHAVQTGRHIFTNMQKAMVYILSAHMPIAGIALLPVLLGWPVVLFPLHIVFLELVINPACALAFENEPPEHDLMRRAPRDPHAALFDTDSMTLALLQGASALLCVLGAYWWAQGALGEPQARAFAFVTLVMANLALIFSNRSRTRTIVESLRQRNAILWRVTVATVASLTMAVYLPFLANVFRFAPLSAAQLGAAAGVGLASVAGFEMHKLIRRLGGRKP